MVIRKNLIHLEIELLGNFRFEYFYADTIDIYNRIKYLYPDKNSENRFLRDWI